MSGAGSFQERRIDLTITLGQGAFGNSGANTVKLSNLRIKADILKQGSPGFDKAVVRAYGVQPHVMNEISTLGIPLNMWRYGNNLLVEAGDAVNGMAIVFNGTLHRAWQDFDEAPETALVMEAWGGQTAAIAPAKPVSYPGSASVATILQNIAATQGWNFENNGVNTFLENEYLAGTATQQFQQVGRDAGINVILDSGTNPPTLVATPRNMTRGGLVPLISATTGLVGYPKFQDYGMSFRCIFNPNIRLHGQIEMQSTTGPSTPQTITLNQPGQPATPTVVGPNGFWYVVSPLTYDLAAQLPGGPWFTNVSCQRVDGPGKA
jgi:hypothetical protein